MLFSMRHTVSREAWSDRLLKWGFWGLNGGLALMTFVSLVPSGFYQFYFAVRDGHSVRPRPEIASGEVIRSLAWARVVPDVVFSAGALLMLLFVAGRYGSSHQPRSSFAPSAPPMTRNMARTSPCPLPRPIR
jgi:nitric oxide reductase subunit B